MKYTCFALLILTQLFSKAQDPIYSQITNSYTYLNPSFMGLDSNNIAQLKVRNQWPNIAGT